MSQPKYLPRYWIQFEINQEKWTRKNLNCQKCVLNSCNIGTLVTLSGMMFYFHGYELSNQTMSKVFQISPNGIFSIFSEKTILQNIPTDIDVSKWFLKFKTVPFVMRHYTFSEVPYYL